MRPRPCCVHERVIEVQGNQKLFCLNFLTASPFRAVRSLSRGEDFQVKRLRPGYLRGPDCKYRESADSCKISQFILFYLKDPFGELFSKMEIKSSIALCFFRKIQKFKLRRGGPRPPGKTMKNSATSLTPYATTRWIPGLLFWILVKGPFVF